jgi:uncharacterized iron-regulated membrane protein
MSFRKLVLWLHLWAGLIAALFIFVEGFTGAARVYGPQIVGALNPEYNFANSVGDEPGITSTGATLPLSDLIAILEKSNPGFRIDFMRFPERAHAAWTARLRAPKNFLDVTFDPHSGAVLTRFSPQTMRYRWLGYLVMGIAEIHGNFLGGGIGRAIIGSVAALLLLLSISGLILWWPRRIFKWRRKVPAARLNFELHNSIGFYSALFLATFSLTAIAMEWPGPSIRFLNFATGAPAPAGPKPSLQPRPPPAKPANPASFQSPDLLLNTAQQKMPQLRCIGFRLFYNNPRVGPIAYFFFEIPGENLDPNTIGSRIAMISVDPITGKPRGSPSIPNDYSPSRRFVQIWALQIHTGEILGKPGGWIAAFFSLMAALVAATGPLIWWNRRRRSGSP